MLLLDADFVPSPTWLAQHKSAKGYARLLEQLHRPAAIVLPAFETPYSCCSRKKLEEGRQVALAAARSEWAWCCTRPPGLPSFA